MTTNYRVGEKVVIADDSDLIGAGIAGTVREIGVACAGGMGMIVDTQEFGQIKGSYDCFARVQ